MLQEEDGRTDVDDKLFFLLLYETCQYMMKMLCFRNLDMYHQIYVMYLHVVVVMKIGMILQYQQQSIHQAVVLEDQ